MKMMTDHLHYEADQFFIDADGMYVFDASKIKDAHEMCISKVSNALMLGHDVVVSNTFTTKWEMEKYLNFPFEYKIHVIIAKGQYGNVHGVPEEAIARMKARWED